MAIVEINKETCARCNACAFVCGGMLIYPKEGDYPRQIPGTDEFCMRCGHCIGICPTGSITHEGDTPWALEMRGILRMHDMGFDIFLRNAPALVTTFAEKGNPMAASDCAIALGYFDLAAKSLGLGCCWDGYFYISAVSFEPMIKAVGLPEGYMPYGALVVGYPKFTYQRIPTRKPARIIWHS